MDAAAPPPVPLVPRTLPELLDGALELLRARPRAVLGVVAWFVVPVQLFVAWGQRTVLGGAPLGQVFSDPTAVALSGSGTADAATWLSLVAPLLTLPLVAAGLTVLVLGWAAGDDPGAKVGLLAAGRRLPALLVSSVVVVVAEFAGFVAAAIGVLVPMTFFVLLAPAIAAEGLGPLAGLRRAGSLAARRFFPLMGFVLVSGFVSSVLGQVLALLPTVVGLLFGLELGWVALGIGNAAASLVTTSLVAGATALAYLDTRIRVEGLDLAVALDGVAALRAPEAGPR